MFNIDIFELVVIAIVILLVLGPGEMAVAMRAIGRFMHRMRNFLSQMWSEIDLMMYKDEFKEISRKINETEKKDSQGEEK